MALGAAALVMRILASLVIGEPAYLDAAYYELVARQLVGGEGFNVPVIWSFLETGGVLPPEPGLPVPSNRHWMPLTAVVSAGSMAIFGTSRFAAELPHAVIGALLVPATAWIGWWLWRSRRVALVSGLLALFAGPMLVYVPMVDSFALFGAFGMVAIAAAIQAVRPGQRGWWLVVSAVASALAALTRIDGMLLGVAPAVALLSRRGLGPWPVVGPRIAWGWAAFAVIAAGLVVAPWLARQGSEFGSVLPSAGGRLLWITTFNEQFSVTGNPSLESYFDRGLPQVVAWKLEGLIIVLGRTAGLLGGAFVVPFLYGLWRERLRSDLAPFVVYWLVLFAAMVLVFTLHAPKGAYYHSAWAWLPFAIPLAVASSEPMLHALGRRVHLFRRPRNIRFLGGAALLGAVILSVVGSASLVIQWDRDYANVETAASYIRREASRGDVVMYTDPPSLNLATGNPAIPPPFESPAVIGETARSYNVRWVVVERAAHAEQDPVRLWEGAPWLSPQPVFDSDYIRIFTVKR